MTDAPREVVPAYVTRPIEKGVIVLIIGNQFAAEDAPRVMNELRYVAGHDRFAIMEVVPGTSIGLHGPEDLKEALRQLAKEALNGRTEEERTDDTDRNHHF